MKASDAAVGAKQKDNRRGVINRVGPRLHQQLSEQSSGEARDLV